MILVGNNPASESYVRSKEKACAKLGIYSIVHRVADTISQEHLLQMVEELNNDNTIHGILVQLPLPEHISEEAVIQAISPDKDVDGFHPVNAGKLQSGIPSLLPCTPHGIMKMLSEIHESIEGMHAVVVGRSNIVGKPIASLLLHQNATVTICHSRTRNLTSITKQADILIAAVGKPKLITAEMVKPGATVIDVGVNRVDGVLVGDVDYDTVLQVAGAITPVPGGVGPMTITMLLYNTVLASKRE